MPQSWDKEPPRDWAEREAQRVASEVRRLRTDLDKSAQWLADRTHELGFGVSRTVIADLENGRRRYVTAAELVVIAEALETAPLALLYPPPMVDATEYLPGSSMSRFDATQRFSALFEARRENVSARYWMHTLQLRAERRVRDRRNAARNMFEIAATIGNADMGRQAAELLAGDIEGSDYGAR